MVQNCVLTIPENQQQPITKIRSVDKISSSRSPSPSKRKLKTGGEKKEENSITHVLNEEGM
jgi:hypothetical protein